MRVRAGGDASPQGLQVGIVLAAVAADQHQASLRVVEPWASLRVVEPWASLRIVEIAERQVGFEQLDLRFGLADTADEQDGEHVVALAPALACAPGAGPDLGDVEQQGAAPHRLEAKLAQRDRVVFAIGEGGVHMPRQGRELAPSQGGIGSQPRMLGQQLGRGDVVVDQDLGRRQRGDLVEGVVAHRVPHDQHILVMQRQFVDRTQLVGQFRIEMGDEDLAGIAEAAQELAGQQHGVGDCVRHRRPGMELVHAVALATVQKPGRRRLPHVEEPVFRFEFRSRRCWRTWIRRLRCHDRCGGRRRLQGWRRPAAAAELSQRDPQRPGQAPGAAASHGREPGLGLVQLVVAALQGLGAELQGVGAFVAFAQRRVRLAQRRLQTEMRRLHLGAQNGLQNVLPPSLVAQFLMQPGDLVMAALALLPGCGDGLGGPACGCLEDAVEGIGACLGSRKPAGQEGVGADEVVEHVGRGLQRRQCVGLLAGEVEAVEPVEPGEAVALGQQLRLPCLVGRPGGRLGG